MNQMNFLDLPVEVGILIFSYFDTKTKINVYNSCNELREYFKSWFHLRRVVLSRSTLATIKTLNESLFLDLGEQIRELNLSAVPDLTVENLKPHMKSLVNLISLDITFTNIYLSDITEICPNKVKIIAINFFKSITSFKNETIFKNCKEFFAQKQFEAVHFVVFQFTASATPFKFLEGIQLIKNLKLTIFDNYEDFLDLSGEMDFFNDQKEIDVKFDNITISILGCAVRHKVSEQLHGVSRLNFNQLEYIFMMYLEEIVVYVSPMFSNTFLINCTDLVVKVSPHLPQNFMLDGNMVFKAWNKSTTNFNDDFFKNVRNELKDFFPTYICMHSQTEMKITHSPSSWYCIDGCDGFEKKLGTLPENITLTDFCRKDGRVIGCRRPIGISYQSTGLKNLRYLRLNNIPLRNEFFLVLFMECPKLITLDIYVEKHGMMRRYIQSLSKSIHLAKLKNFMLTSEDIDYEIVFEIISRCPSMENVHIREYERAVNDEYIDARSMVVLIEKCINLYSLFIEADMSAEGLTMFLSPLRVTAQRLERNHLNIQVCESYCGWNPFVDVFNPSPLHIIN